MSLTGEGIVLSAGRAPDISPPFIPADINTEELGKMPCPLFPEPASCGGAQREQAVIVQPDMVP